MMDLNKKVSSQRRWREFADLMYKHFGTHFSDTEYAQFMNGTPEDQQKLIDDIRARFPEESKNDHSVDSMRYFGSGMFFISEEQVPEKAKKGYEHKFIDDDDITNLKIELGKCKDVNDFINRL